MNENLDLTEILKGVPKGTKFYSRFLGSVEFCKITLDNYIEVIDGNGYYVGFKPNGTYRYAEENTEIDLFPSKDQRDWSKWHRPFVDGDIVTYENQIAIFKKYSYEDSGLAECYVFLDNNLGMDIDNENYYVKDFATEKEKQKLFKVLKDNGYTWNAVEKKMEKIEPKFDVSTLRPFDKVLCRMDDDDIWGISLFERYIPTNPYPFFCIQDNYNQCIPYNDETIYLLGTTQQVSDKYINW